MRTTVPLVLLAAGLGSRYGGVKPLAPVGPGGQPLLAVALDQATRAGFDRAIVVVGSATSGPIREALAGPWRPSIPVTFVSQESVGPPRDKPWGTVSAVLAAGTTSDVVVANGDDLYGVPALRDALSWIESDSTAEAAGVFFPVGGTLSERGGVSRGLPKILHSRLVALDEQRDVQRVDGVIRLVDGTSLTEDQPVSMNLWCFRRRTIRWLDHGFTNFVAHTTPEAGEEYGLPGALDAMLPEMTIDVVLTRSTWLGVTFADDVPVVREALCRSMD